MLDKSQFESPAEYVKANAILKAAFVADNLRTHQASADLVIGSDTVVVIDDRILEKPKSEIDFSMTFLHCYNFTVFLSGSAGYRDAALVE